MAGRAHGGESTPRASRPDAQRWAVLALAGVLGALLALLIAVDKPWELEGGPGFFAASRDRPFRSNVHIGLFWVGLSNVVLCAGLLATSREWTRPLREAPAPGPTRERPCSSRSFGAAVFAAMALALALRLPLAQGSLWWDEGWVLQRSAHGQLVPSRADPSQWEFEPVSLQRALWFYEKPTNHVLYSVAAWTSLRAWRALTGADPAAFDELVFRLPSLAAALLSVLLVALVVRSLGFPRAGPLAALLLAIHPWHVRYGVDGRAYSLLVLFTLASALSLLRLLRRGSWGACALYGASQVLLLWNFPYSIFVSASFGGAGCVGILAAPRARVDRSRRLLRFVVTHLLVAMAVAQGMAPNLTQVPLWEYQRPVSAGVLGALWSGLWTGMLPDVPDAALAAGIPSLASRVAAAPWTGVLLQWALPAWSALGLASVLRRDLAARVVAVGWIGALPVTLVLTTLLEQQFYERYAIFVLPGLVAGLAVGIERTVTPLCRLGRAGRVGAVGAALLLVAAYQAAVLPQTQLLRRHSYSPMRETAALLDRLSHEEPEALQAAFGGGRIQTYAPTLPYLGDSRAVEEFCERAVREQRGLVLVYGRPEETRGRLPEAVARVEDAGSFEPVAEFWGIEPELRYRVARHRGGSCARRSLTGRLD